MSALSDLARHVTVAHLRVPLGPTLRWDQSRHDAAELIAALPRPDAPHYRAPNIDVECVCLVRNPDGDTTHYVWAFNLSAEAGAVSDIAEPILPKHCVSASTPAIVLMRLFAEQSPGCRWRLVLDGTALTGFVSAGELFRPELTVGVLALLLDVEQRCAEAVTWEAGDSATALSTLSPGRLEKAKEMFVRKYGREPSLLQPELVFCTTFADKSAMIANHASFSDLSKNAVRERFTRMERTRNSLAHTTIDTLGELEELMDVVQLAEDTLRRLAPREPHPSIRLAVSNT